MDRPKTSRPFEQRFLDGYGRSELRQEVQKLKRRRFRFSRRTCATWALGASLTFGGLSVPMKFIRDAETSTKMKAPEADPSSSMAIQSDVLQAQKIAAQVESGVQDVATAPVSVLTDEIRQQFFAKEVPFGSVIYDEAKKNNLSPELVAAVVQTESQFNPVARSRVGAVGLMQLVPTTGHWMGANNLLDPVQNISAGTKYLRYLSDHFNGDQQKIVAAYNAGPGNVHRFNGVPPFRETRDYISRVHGFQQDLGDRLATRAE